jgi:hypothetical protein
MKTYTSTFATFVRDTLFITAIVSAIVFLTLTLCYDSVTIYHLLN